MKFYLIVAKGKKQGFPVPIEVDLFLIGSNKMCQLRAVHDRIGPQHCALVNRGKKVFVRDLNSGEATIVNGEVMTASEEWPLHAGDTLEVGPLKFMLQFREKPLSQRDLEEWALQCLDEDEGRKMSAMDMLEEKAEVVTEKMDAASSAAGAIIDRLNAQKGIVKGRLRLSREEGVTIVRINDTHLVEEAELALIKKELHDNLNRPNLRILLDMKNVRRLSSSAADMFGDLRTRLRPLGSKLAFCRVRPEMKEMLEAFPTTQGLPFHADKAAAFKAKW